ncbi:epididymal-specific lipocalin-12 [Mustela erminea]|uniref:epididymal-specific lipocalin-12 n=1 Tax=Mustela erminea TaxID=36723 RepID=UPI001387502C|nr:epididymal-specific lipocalin-12 [Mustela erminea]
MLREGLQVHTAAPETLPSDHRAEASQQPSVPLAPQVGPRPPARPRPRALGRAGPARPEHRARAWGERTGEPPCWGAAGLRLLLCGRGGPGRGERAGGSRGGRSEGTPGSRRGKGCGEARPGSREGGLGAASRPSPRPPRLAVPAAPAALRRRRGHAGSPATAGRPEPLHTARRAAGVTCPPSPNGRDCGRSAVRQVRLQPARRPADGSQEGPAPAQSAAKPSAATSSASSEKFQGEWFVVGLAGSTHRKMDRFLLNPFTAVFEQNKNSRLEVSYAMIRGRRCVSWSYVLIPAAKPGGFSVDSREEPEEVQVYDTDYSVFALMLFRRQSGGQSVLRVTLLCAGPVGRQRRLPGPDRVVTPAGNLLKVDAAPPRQCLSLLAARNKGSVSGSSRVSHRDLGGEVRVGAGPPSALMPTPAHQARPQPPVSSGVCHCGSLRVPSVLPAWPPETRVHRPPHLPSPQSLPSPQELP